MSIVVDANAAETPLYDAVVASLSETSVCATLRERLHVGDVEIRSGDGPDASVLILERKTWDDWVASIRDGRYQEQKRRALHASDSNPERVRFAYLIECPSQPRWLSHARGQPNKPYLCAMLKTQLRDGVPVLHSSGTEDSAHIIVYLQAQLASGGLNVKAPTAMQPIANVYKRKAACVETPDAQFRAMLGVVRGMSDGKVVALATAYPSFSKLAAAAESELSNVAIGNRRLGPVLAKRLKEILR